VTPRPGDIVVCHSQGFIGGAIRFGERLRSPRTDAYWNHCAVVVEPVDGCDRVVQAVGAGVEYGWFNDLGVDDTVHILSVDEFPALTEDGINRSKVVAAAHSLVGTRYGFLTIASVALNLLTPKWVRFPSFRRSNTFICSAAAAWCLLAGGGNIQTYDIYSVMPSEVRAWADTGDPVH
jgi:hypothetical protein